MVRRTIVGSLLLLAAVAGAPAGAGAAAADITVEQVRAFLAHAKDVVILDVRTPAEFTEGHLPGAVNLDVRAPDFEMRLGQLERRTPYLVYCKSGNRSARAVRVMERLEFDKVYHMGRGVSGWQAKSYPLVK